MAAFSLGPLIGELAVPRHCVADTDKWKSGPVIGPIAGGFIAQTIGVKWVFIVIAGMNKSLENFHVF